MNKITLTTKINGVSVHCLILENHSPIVLQYMLQNPELLLSRKVIKLLKTNQIVIGKRIRPLTEKEKHIRKSLLRFNKRRLYSLTMTYYVEHDEFDCVESDYINCNIEIRYGI